MAFDYRHAEVGGSLGLARLRLISLADTCELLQQVEISHSPNDATCSARVIFQRKVALISRELNMPVNMDLVFSAACSRSFDSSAAEGSLDSASLKNSAC